mmetsp:Transcript_37191/g.68372  ORF Transcript_37191/g.68372 Transcript_37191/m.68372 type:complete len:116 (+) Transcript_37191:129-476(+)
MKISGGELHRPPSSNGTIDGLKAAKFLNQLNSAWVQLSNSVVTKIDADWPSTVEPHPPPLSIPINNDLRNTSNSSPSTKIYQSTQQNRRLYCQQYLQKRLFDALWNRKVEEISSQ